MKLFLSIIICYSCVGYPLRADLSVHAKKDHYTDFKELARHERVGADYTTEVASRHSTISVIAIHGGGIEPGSETIVREVAGNDLSYYIFLATKPEGNRILHVTSTHFDDPEALSIVGSSQVCISIHGFKEEEKDTACIGGGNSKLATSIADRLKASKLPITIESPCPRFGGTASENITNRSAKGGAQIELSTHLRKRFLKDDSLARKFSRVIREAVLSFIKQDL
jgi:phage replication-related protein YjqB (UPF0714/DUF867 family)